MTTLETNAAPAEASGEGVRTPEKAVRWAIPLSLLACVLLAFFDKISIAALFSDSHFQQAMGIDWTTNRKSIAEAIPPRYAEYVGHQLMAHVLRANA
ncbi:hypothetical protein [Leucobacter iarius]|uniref:MFS transporter n=1 Tax=Leucobacter iarius TaxID=333963 RepID=A0ABN2LWE7_9MICO